MAAFDEEPLAGFFLPCRVAVFERGCEVHLGMLRPTEAVARIGNPGLSTLAGEVEADLAAAIDGAK
jgi:uncharacterized protein (DUF302 family)